MPSIKTQQTPTFPWQQKQPAPLAIKTPFPKPLMKRPPLQRPNLQFQRPSVAPQMNVPVPSAPQIVKSQPQLPKPRAKTYPSIVEQITVFGLPKIDEFLEDPSVQSIECPGPEKPIIVSRGGMIETTRSTLKSEEIDRIMREISDKTRIPLTTGVFRAAVQGYLITAVISEFVGTRFVIQKKQVS
jgi:hypothetical protein